MGKSPPIERKWPSQKKPHLPLSSLPHHRGFPFPPNEPPYIGRATTVEQRTAIRAWHRAFHAPGDPFNTLEDIVEKEATERKREEIKYAAEIKEIERLENELEKAFGYGKKDKGKRKLSMDCEIQSHKRQSIKPVIEDSETDPSEDEEPLALSKGKATDTKSRIHVENDEDRDNGLSLSELEELMKDGEVKAMPKDCESFTGSSKELYDDEYACDDNGWRTSPFDSPPSSLKRQG